MSGKGKNKRRRRWWQKPRVVRRAAGAAVALLVIVLGSADLLLSRGGQDSYSIRYASHYTLPTTAGDETTLAEHLGKHNVLLYFNEGMG